MNITGQRRACVRQTANALLAMFLMARGRRACQHTCSGHGSSCSDGRLSHAFNLLHFLCPPARNAVHRFKNVPSYPFLQQIHQGVKAGNSCISERGSDVAPGVCVDPLQNAPPLEFIACASLRRADNLSAIANARISSVSEEASPLPVFRAGEYLLPSTLGEVSRILTPPCIERDR